MKGIFNKILGIMMVAVLLSFSYQHITAEKKYKVMVQMKNYFGEGAYVAVSILDKDGKYVKTLQVFGDDEEYFPELKNWWKSNEKDKNLTAVDAISGETLAGGERQIFSIAIDEKYIDSDYSLLFETAVEEDLYNKKDVLIPLTTSNLKQKHDGKGYIRYVKLISAKK